MSQAIGLIEIEMAATVGRAAWLAPCDDATLDGLFARLVGRPIVEHLPIGGCDRTATVLAANLDLLSHELDAATREVLAGIFPQLGGRRL